MNNDKLLKIINTLHENTKHYKYHIEKDYYLDFILDAISKDDILKELLIFKWWTCLSKWYFNYYRMSEDLDFSVNFHSNKNPYKEWLEEYIKLGRNWSKKVRSKISNVLIDRLLWIIYSDELKFLNIKELSHEYCYDNEWEYIDCLKRQLKHNESKLLRLKIVYNSVVTKKEENLLIEISIWSQYWFQPEKIELQSMFEIVEPINILSHNIYQIFSEKFSAMTDRSYHERRIAIRDYFDIQFLYPLIKDNINELIPIIWKIYVNDFLHKKWVEWFIESNWMIDFNFDYDFIVKEIFNQEKELLQPAPNEVNNFLTQENIDYLYENIYFPIQDKVKEFLWINREIHLTQWLINITK